MAAHDRTPAGSPPRPDPSKECYRNACHDEATHFLLVESPSDGAVEHIPFDACETHVRGVAAELIDNEVNILVAKAPRDTDENEEGTDE